MLVGRIMLPTLLGIIVGTKRKTLCFKIHLGPTTVIWLYLS